MLWPIGKVLWQQRILSKTSIDPFASMDHPGFCLKFIAFYMRVKDGVRSRIRVDASWRLSTFLIYWRRRLRAQIQKWWDVSLNGPSWSLFWVYSKLYGMLYLFAGCQRRRFTARPSWRTTVIIFNFSGAGKLVRTWKSNLSVALRVLFSWTAMSARFAHSCQRCFLICSLAIVVLPPCPCLR